MKKVVKNFTGLLSITREVCGVEVRGLNFSDISTQWQTKGSMLIDAYNTIVKDGNTNQSSDVLTLVNDVVTLAPELARDIFLASINDDNQPQEAGFDEDGNKIMMTASEIWTNHMSIGKQTEILVAIMELTVSESDTLKKIFKTAKDKIKTNNPTKTAVDSMIQNQ